MEPRISIFCQLTREFVSLYSAGIQSCCRLCPDAFRDRCPRETMLPGSSDLLPYLVHHDLIAVIQPRLQDDVDDVPAPAETPSLPGLVV